MKLDVLCEDRQVMMIDEMFRNGVVNEGALSILDNAVESAAGLVGAFPVLGDILGDIPMVAKNLVQGDFLGAALWAISAIPEPTDLTDLVGKGLRVIQKIARATGQEKRINKMINWLLSKTPGGKLTDYALEMFEKFKDSITGVSDKVDVKNDKERQAMGVVDKSMGFIADKLDKMEDALKEFLGMVDKRAKEMARNKEPAGGIDAPDDYINDLAEDIRKTYYRLRGEDGTQALKYKRKIKTNAKGKPEIWRAYELVFGPIEKV